VLLAVAVTAGLLALSGNTAPRHPAAGNGQ
jgi:hypothetical protein